MTTNQQKSDDTLDMMIDYESGNLSEEDTYTLFQRLVNNGMAWTLQGSYGRVAQCLIEQGLVSEAER